MVTDRIPCRTYNKNSTNAFHCSKLVVITALQFYELRLDRKSCKATPSVLMSMCMIAVTAVVALTQVQWIRPHPSIFRDSFVEPINFRLKKRKRSTHVEFS